MSVGTSESDDGRSETPSVGRMDFSCEDSSDSEDGAEFSRDSDVPSDMYDEESGGMSGRAMVNHCTLIELATFYALSSVLCTCRCIVESSKWLCIDESEKLSNFFVHFRKSARYAGHAYGA